MDDDVAQKFINSVVKNLQVLCHSNVNFHKNVEVIGHLYLNVDSCTRLNYIVNEKVCKNEASSTVFVSNSFHAEIGSRKKDREPNKPPDDPPPNFQRSQFLHRQSLESNSHKREHPGQMFSSGSKMPRLSDYSGNKSHQSESRQSVYKSPFSPNSRQRLSQDSGSDPSQSLQNSPQKRESPIEIDLTKVKKEFSSGGCAIDRTDGQEHGPHRLGGAFGSESDATPTIDFSTAFPISLHQNQTLSSAISQHETTVGSGNSHNNSAGAGGSSSDYEIDQKPFVHNTIAEPLSPQFSPMIPGGIQRLRPPWLGGEHSGNQSTASSSQQNFSVASLQDVPDLSTGIEKYVSVPSKLTCDICYKQFKSELGFKGHMNTHKGIYPYSCPHCQKGCASKNQLDGHINMHLNQKPYSCEDCGKSYAYNSHYRAHKVSFKCQAASNSLK